MKQARSTTGGCRTTFTRVVNPVTPSRLIDERISELSRSAGDGGGWRGATLSRARSIIRRADPSIVEEWKWNVPVWTHPRAGIICTGEAYKDTVKLTFARGASLDDPSGMFNSSLTGKTRRAIDFHQGDEVDAKALTALVRAAVAMGSAAPGKPKRVPAKPRLLSGGNPQIAKAEGDAPVRAYIAAMPGWKRDIGRRLDAIITRAVPGVRKAVKWNSPFYGSRDADNGWFLSMHCFTSYVKVAFFRGSSLQPVPPGRSKQKEVRYLDIREHDAIDQRQFTAWVTQAARLPGCPL